MRNIPLIKLARDLEEKSSVDYIIFNYDEAAEEKNATNDIKMEQTKNISFKISEWFFFFFFGFGEQYLSLVHRR